jgi:hypothetical protein
VNEPINAVDPYGLNPGPIHPGPGPFGQVDITIGVPIIDHTILGVFNMSVNLSNRIANGLWPLMEILGSDDAINFSITTPIPFDDLVTRSAAVIVRGVKSSSRGRFYSTAFRTELKATSCPGVSRAAHFQEANEALLKAMEADAQFAQTVQNIGIDLERTATGLAPRKPPAGWTWHHAPVRGLMELVPRPQHTPGSTFWETLHPNGRGGYAIWGK